MRSSHEREPLLRLPSLSKQQRAASYLSFSASRTERHQVLTSGRRPCLLPPVLYVVFLSVPIGGIGCSPAMNDTSEYANRAQDRLTTITLRLSPVYILQISTSPEYPAERRMTISGLCRLNSIQARIASRSVPRNQASLDSPQKITTPADSFRTSRCNSNRWGASP